MAKEPKPDGHMARPMEGIRHNGGIASAVRDTLAIEAPLQVRINGTAFTVTMRTPGHDELLVRGLLCTEGIVLPNGAEPVMTPRHHPETGVAVCMAVTLPAEAIQRTFDNERTFMSTSSCGLCGSKEMPETRGLSQVAPLAGPVGGVVSRLGAMMDAMRRHQEAFDQSGGTHGAGLFTEEGECLAVFEDIGRHNAVDKVVGWMLANNAASRGRVLTVSGRVSYEIVLKAWRAGMGLVGGVSAPSTLAVETARTAGIVLAGFCREDRATVYTGIATEGFGE